MASSYSKKDKNTSEQQKKIADIRADYSTYGAQASTQPQAAIRGGLESTFAQQSLAEFKRVQPTEARSIAGIKAPEEVWSFAAKKNLFSHLETAIQLVHECFPSVSIIELKHEIDWESDDESWIAINIEASGEVDDALQQYLLFNRRMVQRISPPESNLILLGINSLKNTSKN